MKKLYCFDFDGTIADTLPIIIKRMEGILNEYGHQEMNDDLLRKLRNEGIEEVREELGLPFYKLFFLYRRLRKEVEKEVLHAEVHKGMREVLYELREREANLMILTSNSKESVSGFLKRNNIDLFDLVRSGGVLGKEKELKKIKRKGGTLLYVGDEPRDIKAGKRADARTVAVPWGLSSRKALLYTEPDVLIERPGDLLNLSF